METTQIKKRKCQNCNVTKNEHYRKPDSPITAIIRTKDVCSNCYRLFKRDNQDRINKEIEIPAELVLLGDENVLE